MAESRKRYPPEYREQMGRAGAERAQRAVAGARVRDWLYLAVVLDAWSRRIVGWAMAPNLRSELVEDALVMAISRRRPTGPGDPSLRPRLAVHVAGLREAVPRSRDRPVAMCESFFAMMECELLDRVRFRTAGRCPARDLQLHRRLLQHPPSPLGTRLPGARALRGNQPCSVTRTRTRATHGPRPLSPRWEGTTELISHTINHRSQLSVKAGQVQNSRILRLTPPSTSVSWDHPCVPIPQILNHPIVSQIDAPRTP